MARESIGRSQLDDLPEPVKALIVFGTVGLIALIWMGIAGNGKVRSAGIWLGSLLLLVLVVAAVVGTTSASWSAGRRVANAKSLLAAPNAPAEPHAADTSRPAIHDAISTELAELARLHREGVLTPEEFASAKTRVLGG